METAITLAEDHGFSTLTRDAVAALADVAAGMVNQEWGTMAALKDEVMRQAVVREILPIVTIGLALGHPDALAAPPTLKERAVAALAG